MDFDWKKLVILIILVILVAVLMFFSYTKNCKQDNSCFDSKASVCSRAKVEKAIDENLYSYEVLGKRKDNCIVRVFMLKAGPSIAGNIAEALKGKGMICEIPLEILFVNSVSDVGNLNSYCTGPLKEMLLEISLNQLYTLVTEKLGVISMEYKDALKSVG